MRRTTANRLRRFRFSAGQLQVAAGDNSTPYFFFSMVHMHRSRKSRRPSIQNGMSARARPLLFFLGVSTMHVNAMGTSAPIFPCRVPTCFLSREHHVFDRLLHRFIVSRLNPRTPDQDGMLWSLVRSCKISGSSKNK